MSKLSLLFAYGIALNIGNKNEKIFFPSQIFFIYYYYNL